MYEYLDLNPTRDKNGKIDLTCSNLFSRISEKEIVDAELSIGMKFPSELRQFYQEVGYGYLTTPKNPPEGYRFLDSNCILSPFIVNQFIKGNLAHDDYDLYMMEDIYEDFVKPGDIPVFEIGDSSRFMMMKPQSDQPNAVWYLGSEKIEDSFSDFIYKLYHDHPAYFSRNW